MAANIAEEIEHPEEAEIGEPQFAFERGENGRIHAAAALTESPYDGNLYISYIATHPEMLGEGHGAALLNKIFKIAADRGVGVSLEATPQSEAFWRKMGAKPAEQMGPYGFEFPPEDVKARVEEKTKPAEVGEKTELTSGQDLDKDDRRDYMNQVFEKAEALDAKDPSGASSERDALSHMHSALTDATLPNRISSFSVKNGELLAAGSAQVKGDVANIHDLGSIQKGAGTTVVNHLLEQLKEAGVKTVKLVATDEAQGKGFYEKLGFELKDAAEGRYEKQLGEPEEPAHPNISTATEVEHPKAPVDIRELKYPPVKDATTGEPITINAYRASDHPEFRTNEERGTFFSPEATPEHGNHIFRAKLEFKNPLVVDDGIHAAAELNEPELAKEYEALLTGWDSDKDEPLNVEYDTWDKADKKLAAAAKEGGYDGIVFRSHDELNPVQYIAVDPKAITNAEKVGQYSWSSLKVEPEEAPEAKPAPAPEKETAAKPAGDWKELHDLGKDHDIPSEEGYVYHATNAERAGDIAESGKLNVHKPDYGTDQDAWPDGSTEKRSYFTKKADTAWQFAPEEGKSVLLRTKLDPKIHKTESTGDLYSKKAIASDKLEVLGADKEWHPIDDLKEEEHHEPIGVHYDDLPYRAKYASVDFDAPDLQDTAKRVTADSIRKDYVRAKDRKKVSVYQSYIPMEDLPTPKFVDEQEENFEREDYRPKIGSPIKVDIHPNGSVNILDGNHRVTVWEEQGQQYAPAWVIDHRSPNIEMLFEDEKAEREEED